MMIRIYNDNLICFIVMHFTFQLNTFYIAMMMIEFTIEMNDAIDCYKLIQAIGRRVFLCKFKPITPHISEPQSLSQELM